MRIVWNERKVADELFDAPIRARVDLLLDDGQGDRLLDRFVVIWENALVDLFVEQLGGIEATAEILVISRRIQCLDVDLLFGPVVVYVVQHLLHALPLRLGQVRAIALRRLC